MSNRLHNRLLEEFETANHPTLLKSVRKNRINDLLSQLQDWVEVLKYASKEDIEKTNFLLRKAAKRARDLELR